MSELNAEELRAVQYARDNYALPSGDSIEIDDVPAVTPAADGGAWVAAWVWVPAAAFKEDE